MKTYRKINLKTIWINIGIVLVLLFIALSMVPAVGAQASAMMSDSIALAAPDATLTVCDTGCDYTTIQGAVNAASAGDTIQIMASVHTEHGILVDKDVTIKGASNDTSTIVQGAAAADAANDRVFRIASDTTVSIRNLTIRHGDTDGGIFGGAGIDNAGTLTLDNVLVTNNLGNGIYNDGTLVVNNTEFSHNVTPGATSEPGGGIYNASGAVATVINTRVLDNIASGAGGGILNAGTMYIENSQINSNECKDYDMAMKGGGIFSSGDLTIVDSTIRGNLVHDTSASEIVYGGGIYSEGILEITNTIIEANYGADENIMYGAGLYIEDGTVEISDSTIMGNYQATWGGGLCVGSYSSDSNTAIVHIDSSTIDNNTANRGGGIYVMRQQINLLNSTINSNSAHEHGGGIYIEDGSGQLTNSTISGNFAENNGGGFYLELLGTDPVYLNNLTITRNRARTDNLVGDGGGIYINTTSSQYVYIKNSILANNYRGFVLPTVYDDCHGELYSFDYNLIQSTNNCTINGFSGNNLTGDPMLDTLGNYGGPTQTLMPLAGSPVIDAAHPGGCETNSGNPLLSDQRGHPRSADGDGNGNSRCDIGAVEYQQMIFLPIVIH